MLKAAAIGGLPEREVLRLLTEVLSRSLRTRGLSMTALDETTNLLDAGGLDSQALLDVILEVEESSGGVFDPERIDFANRVTLRGLASAFVPPT